ncbi:hypothetical protein [Aliikangiella coralliicola]|uniref:Uncharacterized protein n=1 Tax=Aliikangiella coralliicola TaxID=2592383 RepID=A0A545UJN8_9GAMM|nr:hypothetical protein [Aliikangiella coralliicola]TQV89643.1 hypothetical protein FLL46_01810 [Aliikangiella coralliicola]
MKYFPGILLMIALTGCKFDSNSDSNKSITVKATGITKPVLLSESISNTTHEITRDGNIVIKLPDGQKMYHLEILKTNQQSCGLDLQLALTCSEGVCDTRYEPVCGKEPLAGVQCVTTPCPTDRYKTYGNVCEADIANAWFALSGECGGLDELATFHIEPAQIVDLAVISILVEPYQLKSKSIEDDTLTLLFEVAGGCGTHEFSLYVDSDFNESAPPQANYTIGYQNQDDCEAMVEIEKQFDLAPIKENFRRLFPNETGNQTVNLGELGNYVFSID